VIQLKWNSHILNDFRQTFSARSKIFKNPSDPIVNKELGLLCMWIAWTIWLSYNHKYFLCALGMVSYLMSFSFPWLRTVLTFGSPLSLYSFEAAIFLIEVTFIGLKGSSFYLASSYFEAMILSLKTSSNNSSEITGLIESLLGCGILKICFGHCPNSFIWHLRPIL
jgi:hypothetical protein